MPRSGTTLVFGALAAHPELGWFSQLQNRFPSRPSLASLSRLADLSPAFRKSIEVAGTRRRLDERVRVGPSEAWEIWRRCCGERFLFEFLLDGRASKPERACLRRVVEATLRFQGKPRFATKITGPARIGYLASVFGDARFVHLVRDPRAVVASLLRVPFWRESFRMHEPAWKGGLTDEDLAAWRDAGESPAGLAAAQWTAVLREARREAKELGHDRYLEVPYEGFLADAPGTLALTADFAGLEASEVPSRFLARRLELRLPSEAWRKRLDPAQLEAVNRLTAALRSELGYPD